MREEWQLPSFSDDEWSPELVELCLRNRWLLNELALWGAGGARWPPSIDEATIARDYPTDINIMTTRADFQRAWASLSRKERRLLDMYYLEGKTQEEIGRKLGRKHNTIHYRLETVRRRIEKFLGL